MSNLVIRVWREAFGLWWSELWVPRTDNDPPDPSIEIDDHRFPLSIPGYWCESRALNATRRSAVRSARLMRDRYARGEDPQYGPRPSVEIVQ